MTNKKMSLSPELREWKSSGSYISYGPFELQMFVKQIGDPNATANKTLLLIHGFPESSFSYHAILEGMLETFNRIVLFDMLGYGLSDKPVENFTYSLFEQADTVFQVWKHFGISGGHILSHDMGDSVATEIVARHVNGILPSWFSDGIQSITFTNGSMVLDLAKLRITQKLNLSRFAPYLQFISKYSTFRQQVMSAHGNSNLPERQVELLWEANTLQDGNKKFYLTIKYLNDRKRFEKTRWLPALSKMEVPIHICWGDEDAVAKVDMAHYLKKNIAKDATLTIMPGLGHFCQLGSPEVWTKHVSAFYKNLKT